MIFLAWPDIFRCRSGCGQQIDLLEGVVACDIQDDVIVARQATYLRVQNVDANSLVQCRLDDGILRQQRLKLVANVGLSWAHIDRYCR